MDCPAGQRLKREPVKFHQSDAGLQRRTGKHGMVALKAVYILILIDKLYYFIGKFNRLFIIW